MDGDGEEPRCVVVYRGQKIRLSKHYSDFHQYKDDPDNIAPSETARVQKLVISAPIAHSFASWSEMFQAVQNVAFPGYGTGIFPNPKSDLTVVTVEIPRANKDRYFVVQEHNGRCDILDDFVYEDILALHGVREKGGSYVFFDRTGKELFRVPRH